MIEYRDRYSYPWRWALLAELFWRIEHSRTPLRHWGYRQRKAFEHRGVQSQESKS